MGEMDKTVGSQQASVKPWEFIDRPVAIQPTRTALAAHLDSLAFWIPPPSGSRLSILFNCTWNIYEERLHFNHKQVFMQLKSFILSKNELFYNRRKLQSITERSKFQNTNDTILNTPWAEE